jgi:hypothetical protein
MSAAVIAAGWLNDPRVRAQLFEMGATLTDKVRARSAGRGSGSGRPTDRIIETSLSSTDGDHLTWALRQRRLENRADKLAETVEMLRGAPGEATAEALDEVGSVIGRVRLSLAVTKNLPLRRRVTAQREIAAVLGKLEDAVLSATMPTDH